MKRSRVNKNKDRRIFRETANKTKAANVISTPTRGGIRM